VLRRLAEAVETAGLRRREDAVRVAIWRLDSGTTTSPRLLMEACRMARLARDLTLAERLAWAALAAGGGAEANLNLSRILHYLDRYEEAEEVLQEVAITDVGESVQPLVAGVHAVDGRARKALTIVEESRIDTFPSYLASLLEYGVTAAIVMGDLPAAEGYAVAGYRLGEEFGAWNRVLVGFGADRAHVCRLRGELDEALRLCREATARLPRRSVYAGACLGQLAHVLALRGDGAAAHDALRTAEDAIISTGHLVMFPLWLARTWALAADGDLPGAIQQAQHTAAQAAGRGLRAYELTALHDVVRLGAAHLAAPRLAEPAGEVDGPLAALFSRHAAACVSKDGEALDAVSAEFESLRLLVHAAEAAVQAAGFHDEAGRLRAAKAARTRAWSLADRCRGVRTPALMRLVLPELTARQLEIASLAATGLTNRQIAERLVHFDPYRRQPPRGGLRPARRGRSRGARPDPRPAGPRFHGKQVGPVVERWSKVHRPRRPF
jgi:tetratricopeptide (TPR) repeat protein